MSLRWWIFLFPLALLGCTRQTLSAGDCRDIVGRLVELELAERGIQDPKLAAIEGAAFAVKNEAALAQCVGRRVGPNTMSCVRAARTPEELAHKCLE